jgi:hypothetical protein
MKHPVKKPLAYCLILMFLLTCIPGSTLASAGNSVSSGGAVEEVENPAGSLDGEETENPAAVSAEDEITEEALPDAEDGLSQQDISAQATVHEYIRLQRFTGTYDVAGAAPNAPSSSDFPAIAAFQNGQIICSASGIANVSVQMTNGDTKIFHVSVYREYPQPKASYIWGGSVQLQRFAKYADTNYTGDTLSNHEPIHVLSSVSDQTAPAGDRVMQYVKSGNKQGWISSHNNSDEPMSSYYPDLEVGHTTWISMTNNGVPQTDKTWSKSGSAISIRTGRNPAGYVNQ